MSSRHHLFKATKYKNAAPKGTNPPWIRDISVGSYNCHGNFVKASAAFAAFNVNATGSQLGVVPLDYGQGTWNGPGVSTGVSILNAHSDLVTDFDFSPFEDGLLATGSADATVKLWSLPWHTAEDLQLLRPDAAMSCKQKKVDSVCFHPVAEYLLSFAAQDVVSIWDILYNRELIQEDWPERIMAMAWNRVGDLLAISSKDKMLRLLDPRTTEVIATVESHKSDKDQRLVWLGDTTQHLLSSGFDMNRTRQIFIRDIRNFATPIKTLGFESSTGIMIPLLDPDTNMMFFAGRGDCSMSYYEFDSTSTEMLLEGQRFNGDFQTKGVCLIPKRALRVMDCEVNRVLQLTAHSIVPIPYFVPRRRHSEFHSDLFPDTKGTKTSGTAGSWFDGHDGVVSDLSLNPSTPREKPYFLGDGTLRVMKQPLSNRRTQAVSRQTLEGYSYLKYDTPEPQPRPRKKSLTPCSSSEEVEVGDSTPPSSANGTPRFFPVPKPRVNPNVATTGLRTPSSFLHRMAADFSSSATSSSDTSDTFNGNDEKYDADESSTTTPRSFLTDNSLNTTNGDVHNGNGTILDESCFGDGPRSDDCAEDEHMSTSLGRKVFENTNETAQHSSMHNQNGGASGDNLSPRQTRISIAERLKLYQQNASNSTSMEDTDEGEPRSQTREMRADARLSSSSSNQSIISSTLAQSTKGREYCPAPIAKPERKSMPGKMESSSTSGERASPPKTKRLDTVFGQVSKYRNFKVTPLHRNFHLENLKNISPTCPGESEAIQANPDRVAIPLNATGGKLAVFELSRPGRQADGVVPALVHGNKIMDFTWDPFDNRRIAVACDDGKLSVWQIPESGLTEPTNEPVFEIPAHGEKIYIVKFHPLAKDILATASYDLSIRIWNLENQSGLFHISCQEQGQLLSLAWSPCGAFFATMAKDTKIRIYEPRASDEPCLEGQGPSSSRSGRVCWALNGERLIVSGFERSSERQIHVYNSRTLERLAAIPLDVSPTILIPFYDEDSCILFLYGRGDSTLHAFDVIEESPHLKVVSQNRLPGAGHQGMTFLKKNAIDPQTVEFAKAYRLTDVAVEPLSFTVPRVQSEFFQEDLFPPTKVLWEPTMTAEQWIGGLNLEPRRISLRPNSMKVRDQGNMFFNKEKFGENAPAHRLSKQISKTAPSSARSNGRSTYDKMDPDHGKKQQEQLERAMKDKLVFDTRLEQDDMEGVEEDEWNELYSSD